MNLARFHELSASTPPFVSATLDVSRVDRAAEDDIDRRWRAVEEDLLAQGVPDDLVTRMRNYARTPTGRGGEWTLVLVGAGDHVERFLLPGRPARAESIWGPVPHLMPAVRALGNQVSHVVVRIDRTGADLDLSGPDPAAEDHETVEGDHDVVHKVPTGGASQGRLQMRAEDSWERNAEAVAKELDRLVASRRADLILVMGDVRAAGLLERHASGAVAERLVRLETGGRAAGTSQTAEDDAVAEALAVHRAEREAALIDRFTEQLNRRQGAVDGHEAVLEVLDRGQVDQLLLVDDPRSTATVPVSRATGQVVGTGRSGLGDSDLADLVEVPVADVMVWGAVRTRADLTFVDTHQVELRDGVGALLRWSDLSTPHADAPSMPGHGESPGQSFNPE